MTPEKAHKLATAVYALMLAELAKQRFGDFPTPDFVAARDARFAELVEAFKEIE